MKNPMDKIPHFFGKAVVVWCIACASAASFWSFRILSRTGHDPAALLGVALAFFGGELLFLCLRQILQDKKDKKDKKDKEEGQ